MKPSDLFEGENSSLRKTFEKAVECKHCGLFKGTRRDCINDKEHDFGDTPTPEKWEEEFDRKWDGGDDGLFVAEPLGIENSKIKVKSFISTLLASQRKVIEDTINKEIAIHTELAEMWTGISTTGERVKYNPHIEKIEVLKEVNEKLK